MLRYTLQRILYSLPALLGVIALSFLLLRLIPGDPVDTILGEHASESDRQALRVQLGLNQSVVTQFASYVGKLSRLDLGVSLHTHSPVSESLIGNFPATLELAAAALLLALAWGLPLGVWSAVRRSSRVDRTFSSLALIGMSTPGVFLGPMLIYIFAIQLGWFPVSEAGGWESLVLPAISLALPLGSTLLRMTRMSVLEIVTQDYIRTAHAKGLSNFTVYFSHALSNALVPVVTIFGLQLGAMLTGTVITETIFDRPGLGSLLYSSIQRRDYPVVQACVLTVASLYVLINLLTDLTYGAVNPKIRKSGESS